MPQRYDLLDTDMPQGTNLITKSIPEAAAVLRRGGLVVVPTETVFGLGASARNKMALRRVFEVKGRPLWHPLIVHLADASEVFAWSVSFGDQASALAARFWPGPLTLVVKRSEDVPDEVTGGLDTVALRVPGNDALRAVIEQLGVGVAAPSANRFGRLSPTTVDHVVNELGPYLNPESDRILWGPPCAVGIESTIVDLSEREPILLRLGAIPQEEIEACLGRPLLRADVQSRPRAPGQLSSHYAPRAELLLCNEENLKQRVCPLAEKGRRVVVLAPCPQAGLPTNIDLRQIPQTPQARAHDLYALLHELDDDGYDVIAFVFEWNQGLDAAVLDRLQRASTKPPVA